MSEISSVPMTYADVRFRSTLEADWAATLDSLGIVWQYEPEAVRLPSGTLYRPDFYLPEIATWLEVKGPHDERIEKAREFSAAVSHWPDCDISDCEAGGYPCPGDYQMTVIGRAPERGAVTWDDPELHLDKCRNCGKWWWYHECRSWGCRAHRRHRGGDDDIGGYTGYVLRDTEGVPFVRAPRGAAA